jgi:hypothetical protein
LILDRVPEVELDDGVEAPGELALVGEVREEALAVAIGEVVLAGVAVLQRSEERRVRVDDVQRSQAAEDVRRAGAGLGVLVDALAVDRVLVLAERRLDPGHERHGALVPERRERRGPDAQLRGELGIREPARREGVVDLSPSISWKSRKLSGRRACSVKRSEKP